MKYMTNPGLRHLYGSHTNIIGELHLEKLILGRNFLGFKDV